MGRTTSGVTCTDTHCHIHELLGPATPVYDTWHRDDAPRTAESVLLAARAVGVKRLIVIGTTLRDSELAAQFAQSHESVWAAVGLHPHEAKNYTTAQSSSGDKPHVGGIRGVRPEVVKRLQELAREPNVVAIGECGLDYHYTLSPPEDQEAVVRFQIELALEHDLPLSFHVREAFGDFWRILADYPTVRGVLHSFTDSEANLERAIERGLCIGVNGIATFARSAADHVIYRTIPQHLLLLETDAPFLTPAPFRGKVCEPRHIVQTAEYIAALRGEDVATLAAYTNQNAQRLFRF